MLARPSPTQPETGLRQVLDLEATLAAELDAARAEAGAIREAAIQAAAAAAREAEEEARRDAALVLTRNAEQAAGEETRVRTALESRIQALEQLTPERIEAIARELLPLLVPAPTGAGP
jgi:hypothetical protein